MSFQLGKGMFVFFFRLWYRKIYVHRLGPIPEDAPVIFACTHPNSAVDYLFAPFANDKPTYVLVRGDVFEKRLLNAFFRYMYMLPVYRFRDGFSALNRNEHSFRACYEQFDNNQHLLIFSEGNCVQEKRLQPIQKGTARLALDYLFKHGGKSIYVVPMANNYTAFRKFRASVMVNFGEAIDASQYGDLYLKNPNHAYEAFTADISSALREIFIHAEKYSDASWLEKCLVVLRANRRTRSDRWIINDETWFNEEMRLTDWVNANGEEAIPNNLKERLDQLPLSADLEGLLVDKKSRILNGLKIVVLAPFVFAGGVTVLFPYLMGRWIINNKIKDVIFENSVTTFGGMVFYYLQTALLLLIALLIFGAKGLLVVPASFVITAIGLELVDDFLHAWNQWQHRAIRTELQVLYGEIQKMLETQPVNPSP